MLAEAERGTGGVGAGFCSFANGQVLCAEDIEKAHSVTTGGHGNMGQGSGGQDILDSRQSRNANHSEWPICEISLCLFRLPIGRSASAIAQDSHPHVSWCSSSHLSTIPPKNASHHSVVDVDINRPQGLKPFCTY